MDELKAPLKNRCVYLESKAQHMVVELALLYIQITLYNGFNNLETQEFRTNIYVPKLRNSSISIQQRDCPC